MERGVRERVRQQRSQRVGLVPGDPGTVPAEPAHVLAEALGQHSRTALAQGLYVVGGTGRHDPSRVITRASSSAASGPWSASLLAACSSSVPTPIAMITSAIWCGGNGGCAAPRLESGSTTPR